NTNRVLAAICGEEETPLFRNEYARDTLQSANRPKEPIGSGVYDVDIIVRRMGDAEPRAPVMDGSVINATFPSMRGKLAVAQTATAHRGACSYLACPSSSSLQH